MKMRLVKDYGVLDAWKRNPRGYAVVMASAGTKVESVATGTRIALVRITSNVERAVRQLEKIREVFDIDPNGMAPRLVVISSPHVARDTRNVQFMRRAAAIVEV